MCGYFYFCKKIIYLGGDHLSTNEKFKFFLIFAFNVCRYAKSNAIVLAQNESTIGIGSGQPSRIDSCKIAIDKMKKFSKNHDDISAASDAFFPFVDGIEKLVQFGCLSCNSTFRINKR